MFVFSSEDEGMVDSGGMPTLEGDDTYQYLSEYIRSPRNSPKISDILSLQIHRALFPKTRVAFGDTRRSLHGEPIIASILDQLSIVSN